MSQSLEELRQALIEARQVEDCAIAVVKRFEEDFLSNPKVAVAMANKAEASRREKEAVVALRKAILEDFAVHHNKAPLSGLGVREVEKVTILAPEVVLEWCQNEALCLLQVNEKAVIAFHKNVAPVPGIETCIDLQATISANLT